MQNNDKDRRISPINTDYQNKVNTDEIDAIRQNEIAQRKKRDFQIRQERLKRAKRKRIITMIKAWATLIGVVLVAIALIVFIVSAIRKAFTDEKVPENAKMVSADILEMVQDFEKSNDILYSSESNKIIEDSNKLLKDYVTSPANQLKAPAEVTEASTLLWQARRFAWQSDKTNIDVLKSTLREYPIYSNGYIWSSNSSMGSSKSNKNNSKNGYFYDNNARYISAVCELVLWNLDTSFLEEKDTTSLGGTTDVSSGKTVLSKIEEAAGHYFDKTDTYNGGGIRYNETDGLVYVLTTENNGLSNGYSSNYWHNHRFGYIDAYNNIAFNQAMTYLSEVYTLLGDNEKSERYKGVAEKNKKAINNTFWNDSLGRYIGAKDIAGNIHDLGYTFLNLEAVSCGIADGEKSEKIMAWIDGKRKISGDKSTGADIYKFGYAPRTNTVAASSDWWNGDMTEFGGSAQNGGASLVTAYYDLMARIKTDDNEGFLSRYKALLDAYNSGAFASNAKNGEDAVVASMAVYGLFCVETDGNTLYVTPNVGEYSGTVGIKNIGYGFNSFDFAFSKDAVLVFADYSSVVRLNIGGFEKNTQYTVKTVENGEYKMTENVSSDKSGRLTLGERFGDSSYLVIQKAADEK